MPEELTVTDLIPDLIIVDKARKVVDMFEITIPAEKRIEAVDQRKATRLQCDCGALLGWHSRQAHQ